MTRRLPFEKTRDYALSRRGFAALSLGTVASVPAMAAERQSPRATSS